MTMKGSLFRKANPMAVARKKKNQPTCLNCRHNKTKKQNYIDARVSEQADVVFILPSTKFNGIRKIVKSWQKKNTLIDKIAFMPDVMCSHNIEPSDNKYAVLNLHCSYTIRKQLKNKPNVTHIFLIGVGAVRSYFGDTYCNNVSYTKLQGFTFPDLHNNVMVSVVYEPSYDALAKDQKDACVLERTIFKQDLQKGMLRFGETINDAWRNPEQYCHTVSEAKAVEYMDAILNGEYSKFVAVDYETTGLKPFRKGQAARSVALCTSSTFSFSFILTKTTNEKLGKILASAHIPIVAANNPFEYKWSHALGFCINNLIYDCCLGAHLLNQRGGIVSVKFQAHMAFGIYEYEKSMKQYLMPSEKETDQHGANAINRINTCPEKQLLTYNAIDSLVEYWLAEQSMELLGLEL